MKRYELKESNMNELITIINDFFKQDTRIYAGKKNFVIGTKKETFFNDTVDVPILEKRDYYRPFFGHCKEHHARQEAINRIKEGKEDRFDKWTSKLLLTISNEFEMSGIPISSYGYLEIDDTKLFIHTWRIDYLEDSKKFDDYTFVHTKPITSDEKNEVIKGYLTELIWENTEPYDVTSSLRDILNDVRNAFEEKLQTLDLSKNNQEFSIKIDGLEFPIFIDVKESKIETILNDEKTHIMDLIFFLENKDNFEDEENDYTYDIIDLY